MSAIAGISAATSQTTSSLAPPPSVAPPNQKQMAGNAAQPAIIVSLSSNAAASASAAAQGTTSLAAKVEDALYQISGANGAADAAAHFDYAVAAAKFGTAIANQDKAAFDGAAAVSASMAFSSASTLGIPITDSVSPDAARSGGALGAISVGAFSFTDGGSTYALTPGKDGTLIGTRNGQAWLSMQLTYPGNSSTADSGASAALATLNAIAGQKSSGISLSA